MTATADDRKKPRVSLTSQIFIALVLGAGVGLLINQFGNDMIRDNVVSGFFAMVGTMFTNALKMLVVPLVTFSLISGVAGIGDVRKLGRVGGYSLGIYVLTTAVAIILGLLIANIINPGQGFELSSVDIAETAASEAPSAWDVLASIVPSNPIHAFSSGNMLQIIFYVVVLSCAALMLGDISAPFIEACEYMNELMMKIVDMVMYAAPYGVFCLIARTFALEGFDLFVPVLSYVATLSTALILHLFVVLMAIFYVGTGGLSPLMFLRKMRSAQVFAFSTASSAATIPVTMQCVTHRIGANNSVASFVVPFGATINMDGTAIMQGVATVFMANVYGLDLTMGDYATIISMSVLASIGTAGVPGVGLVMLTMVLDQVGLPIEGVALILGVDRILDMMRTVVNISGDAAVTTIVAKREGLLDIATFLDPRAGEVDSHDFDIDPEAEKRLKEAAKPQHEWD